MDSILLASSTGRDGDTSQSDHAHVGSVAGAPLARRLIFCPLLMETSASCRRALSLAAPPPLAAFCLLLSLLSFSLRRSPFLAFPWCPKRFWGRARGSANARRAKDYGNLALFPSRFFSFVLADGDLLSESRVKGQLENQPSFPETRPFVVVARGLSTGRDSGRGVCSIPQHILLFLLLTPLSLSAQILDKTS